MVINAFIQGGFKVSLMNFVIGFLIIFGTGIGLILLLAQVLAKNGFSEMEILVAKFLCGMLVIAIPPLLLLFGRNYQGENKIEEIGKPVSFFASLLGHSLSSPTTIIIFLLIIIINILVWQSA